MSLTRPYLWLAAVVAVVSLANVARGQHFDNFQPFIEPNTWNPDLQFFAPAEVDTFGGEHWVLPDLRPHVSVHDAAGRSWAVPRQSAE